jgi:hypothetical protein
MIMIMMITTMTMMIMIRDKFYSVSQCAYVYGNISETGGLPKFFQEFIDGIKTSCCRKQPITNPLLSVRQSVVLNV